jgi:hypothetical protein
VGDVKLSVLDMDGGMADVLTVLLMDILIPNRNRRTDTPSRRPHI